jgi:site-specific recombinase XerC
MTKPITDVISVTNHDRKHNTDHREGHEHRLAWTTRPIATRTRPHTGSAGRRHAFITAALDAGGPLRDVQEAASHADPRATMRYDRARTSLDRHATYIVAAYVAGAAR